MVPQAMNLATKEVITSFTKAKPSAEDKDTAQAQITKISAKNIATPVTRCRIEAVAVTGMDIVVRSRFTGLCFFTVSCLSTPYSELCCHYTLLFEQSTPNGYTGYSAEWFSPIFYLSVSELISNPRQYIFHDCGIQFMFNFVR